MENAGEYTKVQELAKRFAIDPHAVLQVASNGARLPASENDSKATATVGDFRFADGLAIPENEF